MVKYDAETYLLRITSFLQANLNTQIAALNSEKNDAIVLKSISNAAYFVQSLNETVANYNPHVLVGLDDIQSQGDGPGTVETMTFSVTVIMEDRGEDLVIGQRLLRYLRVLKDLFNSGFDRLFPHATFKVNSLVPIALTSVNTNEKFRAVGVQVVTALG